MPREIRKKNKGKKPRRGALAGKRILITGGLGFIGSNLAHACVAAGATVTIYDCLDPKSGGNMYNMRGVLPRVEIMINDIRNFEAVCASVMRQDIIFHCAAYTSHPNSMREPLVDIEVNSKGTINLLEAARRFNPEARIVYVGTSTQVGRMLSDLIDENHPEFPLDIYSANKSVAEKYTLIYHSAYRLQTTVVRLVNTFGPRSNITTGDTGFINYFVGLGLQRKNITVYGRGEQLRSLLYVDDAVAALIAAATRPESVGEVFFASNNEPLSVSKIAESITRLVGGRVTYVEWPKARGVIEVGDAVVSNQKIKQRLKWQPNYSFTEGLALTKRFFKPVLTHYIA